MLCLALAAGCGCVSAHAGDAAGITAEASTGNPAGATVMDNRPADLTVFFTSDTRGMLRRCGCAEGQLGGLSARATYLKTNRVPGRTLVLDGGDTLFDSLFYPDDMREFYRMKSGTVLEAFKLTGVDAVSVGDYDFAYGPEFLISLADEEKFPFVSTNMLFTDAGKTCPPFCTSVIKKLDGVDVGIVSVLDESFPYASFPKCFKGVVQSEPAGAVKAEVEKLRGRAGLVILLAHMSVMPVEELAAGMHGVDLIVQGHSQEHLEEPIRVGDTIIVKGFTKGKYIGRLDLWLSVPDGDGRRKVADYKYSVDGLDESIPPDMEVESLISGYRARLKERAFVYKRELGDNSGGYAGVDVCRQCHAAQYENWSKTRHAGAFADLVTTSDQFDPECLACHTTGYGFVTGYDVLTDRADLKSVTCEDCHGRGTGHVESKRGGQAAHDDVVVRTVTAEKCMSCHDEYNSPHFQYEPYKDMGGAHRGGDSR